MAISALTVRRLAVSICAAGIAGMIVTSALNHNGAAITFGIVTAVAVLCSMVATAVDAGHDPRQQSGPPLPADALAAIVEEQIRSLVVQGADESSLRALVGESVRLGRSLSAEARP